MEMNTNMIASGMLLAATPALTQPASLIEKFGLPLGFVFIMILVAIYQEKQRNKREASAMKEREAHLEALKQQLTAGNSHISKQMEWLRNKIDNQK